MKKYSPAMVILHLFLTFISFKLVSIMISIRSKDKLKILEQETLFADYSLQEYHDKWKQSFTDFRKLQTSPIGNFLVPVLTGLHRFQNPETCSSKSFLLLDYHSSFGFGAHVKHFVTFLYLALRTDRILVVDDSHPFYWGDGCKNESRNGAMECFFLPLTKCSPQVLKKLMEEKSIHEIQVDGSSPVNSYGVPFVPKAIEKRPSVAYFKQADMGDTVLRKIQDMVAKAKDFPTIIEKILLKPPGKYFTLNFLSPRINVRRLSQVAFAVYFCRLSSEMAEKIGNSVIKVLANEGFKGGDNFRLIGVPIRGSDKCRGNQYNAGEMTCVQVSTYLESALRVAAGQAHISHILLTSEDANLIKEGIEDEFKSLQDIKFIRNSLDIHVGSGAEEGRRKDISRAEMLFSGLITLHLQAFAEYHVLTPRSTFASLIYAFALASPSKKAHVLFPLADIHELEDTEIGQIF